MAGLSDKELKQNIDNILAGGGKTVTQNQKDALDSSATLDIVNKVVDYNTLLTHINDNGKHLSPNQNDALDSVPTLSAINPVVDIHSFTGHTMDVAVHVTEDQSNALDSNSSLNSGNAVVDFSTFGGHTGDNLRHLTPAQNDALDARPLSGVNSVIDVVTFEVHTDNDSIHVNSNQKAALNAASGLTGSNPVASIQDLNIHENNKLSHFLEKRIISYTIGLGTLVQPLSIPTPSPTTFLDPIIDTYAGYANGLWIAYIAQTVDLIASPNRALFSGANLVWMNGTSVYMNLLAFVGSGVPDATFEFDGSNNTIYFYQASTVRTSYPLPPTPVSPYDFFITVVKIY